MKIKLNYGKKTYPLNKSRLFRIKYLSNLYKLLNIDEGISKEDYQKLISSYFTTKKDYANKMRIIHSPCESSLELNFSQNNLKFIHNKIASLLARIETPSYIHFAKRKHSYITNAKAHLNHRDLFTTDIKDFFPSITKSMIFKFFRNKMECSHQVANVLAEICTVNGQPSSDEQIKLRNLLKLCNLYKKSEVNEPSSKINEKLAKINELLAKMNGRLPTGSQISMFLAYFVNMDMFEELNELANKHHLTMTVYVDDLTFSGEHIPKGFKGEVAKIVHRNGFRLNHSKNGLYLNHSPKKVTGLILDQDSIRLPNKKMLQLHKELSECKELINKVTSSLYIIKCVLKNNSYIENTKNTLGKVCVREYKLTSEEEKFRVLSTKSISIYEGIEQLRLKLKGLEKSYPFNYMCSISPRYIQIKIELNRRVKDIKDSSYLPLQKAKKYIERIEEKRKRKGKKAKGMEMEQLERWIWENKFFGIDKEDFLGLEQLYKEKYE